MQNVVHCIQQHVPTSNTNVVEVNMRGEVFVVGTNVLPFHVVTRAGRAFLFNVERVSASEIDPELACRLASYGDAGISIPRGDFAILQVYGLIANPSDDVREFLVEQDSRYRGCIKTLVLNVVQACNLRCGYCFAGDGSYGNSGMMSIETATRAIDWYANQHTISQMEVNFFGGEPLVNFALIRRCVEYAHSVAQDAGKRIAFSITTNATLVTQEMAQFLAENKFRIAVSIDGPAAINNRNRPLATGKGSLERILAGVYLLREAGNKPIARCTVHGQTDMEDVRGFLASVGFKQIHVAKATLPKGQEDDAALSAVLRNARLEGIAVSTALREGQDIVNCVSKLADLIVKHQKQTRACGVGDKIASVGIDGGVYACHRFTNDMRWKIAHVEDGDNPARFVDRPVNDIEKCRQCWAKYLCAGGCRHDNYSATGDPFSPPDEFCLEMKAYAEEAIIIACEVNHQQQFSIKEKCNE